MGQRCGLSIESAELAFTDSRERSVYGTIFINTKFYRVHPLYKRSSGEAEAVSGGGGHLSLCGPYYFVDTFSPTAMYVDLREVGKASSFIYQRVLLELYDIAPSKSKSISVEASGEEGATLTIHMTPICPSIPTSISLELSYPDSYNEWLVSGSVTAIQALRKGKTKRSLCLFNRRSDDPTRVLKEDGHVSPGRHKARIIPDRKVFVAPLCFEKSYIEKMDKLLAEAGHPSSGMVSGNDTYNGVGCYLSVDVDLKFVDSVDETKSCLVQRVLLYQFKCTHEHRAQFRASLKGPVLREKKEPKLPRLSTDIDDDEIEVALTLVPYAEIAPDMDGEPYEAEMPLYTELDFMSTSSDSSSAGYMFGDDEQTESKGEEINKPVTDQMQSKDEEALPITDEMDEESSTPITDQKKSVLKLI